MKFKDISIENFGTIGKAAFTLDERGLVLIQGQNDHNSSSKSNGAGKSTAVEAISWALFGKTAKGQVGDSVINRRAGKGCAVTLTLQDDGDQYQITRGRKHKTFKNKVHVAHNGTDITKGTDKLTQEVIDKIIGCPYEVFVGAVYAGQEKMPDLPAMTDKHLKLLIEEAAGITLLEQASAVARERMGKARLVHDAARDTFQRSQDAVLRAQERIQDASESVLTWTAERDARIIDLETAARTILRDAKANKAELEKLKTPAAIEREQALLTNKMEKHESEKKKLATLNEAARTADSKAHKVHAVANQATKQFERLKTELAALQDEIGKPCRTCGRAHDKDSLSAAIKTKREESVEAARDAKEKIKLYKDAYAQAQSASQSATAFENDMTDMSEALALSRALSEQLTKVQTVKRAYDDCMARAQEKIDAVKAEKAKENPYTDRVAEREAELVEVKKDQRKLAIDLKAARARLKIAEDCVKVYAPKGVRAHVLDTVTPYLNDRTAHYLGAMTDGEFEAIWQTLSLNAAGEPRENFSIQVTGDDGGGSFADLSGGEKRKVRIACALALQDLVATRATKSIELFIADEIDAALDVAGLERLMTVLEEKARERGSVFIISHSDLRDWVSNIMTVKKNKGVSEII